MEKIYKCLKCELNKPESEFYLTKKGKLNSRLCRPCKSEHGKTYYSTTQRLERIRAWRKANPELYKAQGERAKTKVRTRRALDSVFDEQQKEAKRLNARKNFITGMVGRARQRSVKYDVPFTITVQDIIVPEFCPLLNVPLILGTKGDYQFSPSIDRLNPLLGYIPSNIRVISTLANTMKNNATHQQLLEFAKNIERYLTNMI